MANAKNAILRFAEEVTFGTTPAVAGQIMRVTNFTFNPLKNTARSDEIVSTDVVADYIEVGQGGEGSCDFELTVDDDEWMTLFEGITGGAWSADTPSTGIDRLTNGTTDYSYSIEAEFDDITEYKKMAGCVLSSMSLSYRPGAILGGSMSWIAASHADMAATTAFTGSTAASTVSPIGGSASGLTTVNEGGGATTLLLEWDVAMSRNLTPRVALGSDTAASITRGALTVEGSALFDLIDDVLYSKFEDHTQSSFQLLATDGANSVDISLPAIRYLTGTLGATGRDGTADFAATWGAKDNGSGVMIQIDRTT